MGFTRYTKADYVVARMHQTIADALHQVELGNIKRLMIFTPPRHGKSELVSRRWPARYLGMFPNRQFIGASYGQELAGDFGRDVRNIIASQEYRRLYPNVSLATDSSAKGKWHTNKGGVYISAGVGVGITGRGADVLSIDDPIKDRAEAESPTIRESIWNWYTSTAYTRLMPGGAVVLTQTRWHEDDLAGRLLTKMAEGGQQWHIINLPAINEDGTALWPERYSLEDFAAIRSNGERDWQALYMQDPRPLEGGLFKTAQLSILDAAPAGSNVVRAWDLAATAQAGTNDPDWTVGVKMLRTSEGRFVILDMVRMRGGPEQVQAAVMNTAAQDGRACPVYLAQDPGQAGKSQILDFTRRLAGWRVLSERVTGDKSTRAAPLAAQVNVGNVSLVKAPWNMTMIEELRGFPSAKHDDIVDAAADAFSQLIGSGGITRAKVNY